MKKPFLRSLLAAVLAGILAGAPVFPAFAQEPASNPAPQAPAKDAVPISLTVNGEVKQNGNTSQFIYTPEEQIEFASNICTLEPGDLFYCGTCGGVGQGTNTFLKVGDVMETEIEGLGRMRNRFVEDRS